MYPGSPVTLPPPGCPVTLYPVVCIMLMLHRHASRCSHCSINVIFSSCILAYLQLDRCNIKSERKVLSIYHVENLRNLNWYNYIVCRCWLQWLRFCFQLRKNDCFQHFYGLVSRSLSQQCQQAVQLFGVGQINLDILSAHQNTLM